MYTRKIYEPEKKLLLQIPGHGIGSAAGTAAQQEVWGKATQPRSPQAQATATGAAQGGRRYTTKMGLPSLYVPEENTWLSRGSFGDGYQFGDVTRGITGTMLDATQNVFAGAARIGETAIDSLVGRAAGAGLFEDELSAFVKRDLINEEAVGGVLARNSLPGLAGAIFGVDPERDSFLGDKGDAVAQSAGQLALAAGVNSVGIPGELVSAISSYGSEMERALKDGATPRQANVSATISALGEVITEKASGAIKFGGNAWDDALVDHLTDGISNKFWKTLVKTGFGGVGEGNEEIASEMISRFGQWLTYQNDESLREMLFSGEAREAYLDAFLGGFFLGGPAGGIDTVLSEDGKLPGKGMDVSTDVPAPAVPVGSLTDAGIQGVKALADSRTPDVGTAAADAGTRAVDTFLKPQKQISLTPRTQSEEDMRTQSSITSQPQTDTQTPYLTSDIWTNDLEGMWTDPGADPNLTTDSGSDMDPDLWRENDSDTEAETQQKPLGYEDYLRQYLSGDSELSTPNADPATLQRAAPKTKEQIISELAPKIANPGITPARAMMEAQRMYTEAEKIFGADTDIVLEMLQPDQNPRKFLDGFQNAYLSGKLGDKAALENSTAAAYLTEEQRETAFDLGSKENGRRQLDYANDNGIIAAGSVLDHFDRKIRLSDISEDLKKVNPNYSSREHQWTHNCQRCVATYEMRRRGFNVTAKPILVHESFDTIAKNWSKVWTNDPPLLCRAGNGKAQIEAQMKRWGDGARAIVCVKWKEYDLAHVFVAENRNGTIVYTDPQNGNENCSNYFSRAKEGCTQVLRVDKCTPTDLILECCQNVR